jgi:hypothetical protein
VTLLSFPSTCYRHVCWNHGTAIVQRQVQGYAVALRPGDVASAVVEPVAAVEPDKAVTGAPKAEIPQIELQQPINTPNSAPGSPATDISAMEVASIRSTPAAKEVAKVPANITVLTVPRAPMVTTMTTMTAVTSTPLVTTVPTVPASPAVVKPVTASPQAIREVARVCNTYSMLRKGIG